MSTVFEPARELVIGYSYDVIVAGGGPAGIAAALAAARAGAKTAVIEQHGCLGGIWTTGLLTFILDCNGKSGLMQEIIEALNARNSVSAVGSGQIYDAEKMKIVLEELAIKAGVDIRYYTQVRAALTLDGQLRHLITESKSGREAWTAQVFIDATGDGDLSAQAGCGFDLGRPEDGAMQPMTLMALLSGITYAEIEPWVHDFKKPYGSDQQLLVQTLSEAGAPPSYLRPILLPIRNDLFALMANHQYGYSSLDAAQLTAATLKARAEVNGQVDALRASGGPWSNLSLIATGAQIGVREGRRIHGLYEVTEKDLGVGARHEDGICRATFPVDVHSPNDGESKGILASKTKALPYDIPLRALVARDVDGLLMAGRCISGDFVAHSSYRVTGNSVMMGQAAGEFAAACCAVGTSPHKRMSGATPR